jgi:hypothetical protein
MIACFVKEKKCCAKGDNSNLKIIACGGHVF